MKVKVICILILMLLIGTNVVAITSTKTILNNKSTTIIQITNNEILDSGNSLIQTDAGTYILAWFSESSGNRDIWISKSSDTINWDNPIQVTVDSESDYNPSITEANSNHLLIGFTSNRPGAAWAYLTRSTDNGNSWSTPIPFEPVSMTEVSGSPCIFKSQDGTLYFSRHEVAAGKSYTLINKSTDNGYNWINKVKISNHNYVLHSEIKEYDGALYMACDSAQGMNPEPFDLYFYVSYDNGDTWAEISTLESNYHDRSPSFIKTEEGLFIVVWSSEDRDASGTKNLYYSISDNFIDWTPTEQLMVSPSYNDVGPHLLKNNDDEIYICWVSDRDGDYEIYITELSNFIESDLDCMGNLSWTNVKPGETVTDSFDVTNIGKVGSLLNWEIKSYPEDWGDWSFNPESGTLSEGDTVTINVEVVAPDDPNKEFSGKIKVVNSDNSTDFCEIDVNLTTSKNKAFNIFLLDFFKTRPNLFPILQKLLQQLGFGL